MGTDLAGTALAGCATASSDRHGTLGCASGAGAIRVGHAVASGSSGASCQPQAGGAAAAASGGTGPGGNCCPLMSNGSEADGGDTPQAVSPPLAAGSPATGPAPAPGPALAPSSDPGPAPAPLLSFKLPVTGNLGGMEVLPSADELRELLHRAVGVASTLAATRPHIANLDKLARRIQSDLDFVRRCCAHNNTGAPAVTAAEGGGVAAAPLVAPAPPVADFAVACVTAPAPSLPQTAAAGTAVVETVAGAAATAVTGTGYQGAAPLVRAREALSCGENRDGGTRTALVMSQAASSLPAPLAPELISPAHDGGSLGAAAPVAAVTAAAAGFVPPPLPLTPDRVQGIINNLRGFQGELLAAQLAPGVVGVSRRFQARVALPPSSEQARRPSAAPHSGHDLGPQRGEQRRPAAGAADLLGHDSGHAIAAAPPSPGARAAAPPAAPAGTELATTESVSPGPGKGASAGTVGRKKRPLTTTEAPDGADGGGSGGGGGGDRDAGRGIVTAAAELPRAVASSVAAPAGAAKADAAADGPDRASSDGASGGGGAGGKATAARGGGKAQAGGGGSGGSGGAGSATVSLSVEVDVVAQEGHCWIEVKNQEAFGTESVHWLGSSRRCKGLRRQVAELLAVAAHPAHSRRWRAPVVVVFFPEPGAASPEVVRQLEAMGAHAAVGPDALLRLPPPPPLPPVTNLDVTTMCGLVSEVSNGGATDPAVEAWAQRTVHWVECLAAERASPLLAELDPWVGPGCPLLAADLACRQFQVLVDMFAGPRERARWAALQERLTVVATEGRPEELSARCLSLLARTMGRDQLAVFGLGDARRALTLSANGNAVRSAERAGVALEVRLHRPVWLTGM